MIWGAHVDVPHRLVDVVGPRPDTKLGSIPTDSVGPLLRFKGPNGARKEPGSDKVQETG